MIKKLKNEDEITENNLPENLSSPEIINPTNEEPSSMIPENQDNLEALPPPENNGPEYIPPPPPPHPNNERKKFLNKQKKIRSLENKKAKLLNNRRTAQKVINNDSANNSIKGPAKKIKEERTDEIKKIKKELNTLKGGVRGYYSNTKSKIIKDIEFVQLNGGSKRKVNNLLKKLSILEEGGREAKKIALNYKPIHN